MHSTVSEIDEFYVGYAARAPRGLARFITRTVIALGALGMAACLILVFGQQPFPRATFEFQQYRQFAGVLETKP